MSPRAPAAPAAGSAISVDTDAARRLAALWHANGDVLRRIADELTDELCNLAMDGSSATRHVNGAAEASWIAATFARLVADEVERVDTLGSGVVPSRAIDAATMQRLSARAAGMAATVGPLGAGTPYSPPWGDPFGIGSLETRSPYRSVGIDALARGRGLVARALADTGDGQQLRADEFGLVDVGGGRFVVVLPGVTDLSGPDLGWSDAHRSVRDLDQAAIESSRSTSVAGNRYAQLVLDGLRGAGVPPGAELLIVGHSFGADTALDLAADPRVNGPGGYSITHVVAAGYHSEPQLADVPGSTDVLVLQNHRDVPVIVEHVGEAHVAEAVASRWDLLGSVARLDLAGTAAGLVDVARHDAGVAAAALGYVGSRIDDIGDVAIGIAANDPIRIGRGSVGLVTLEPGVREIRPGVVVDVFVGGGSGAGHHQHHYIDRLDALDDGEDAPVREFLASLDRAGFTRTGAMVAIDVSVPADD